MCLHDIVTAAIVLVCLKILFRASKWVRIARSRNTVAAALSAKKYTFTWGQTP